MTYKNRAINSILTLLALTVSTSVSSSYDIDNVVYESRYVTTKVGVQGSQKNVLQSVLTTDIPDSVKNIGEAINYLVSPYGYHLLLGDGINDAQYVLLSRLLPISQRHFDAVSLKEILSTLGAEAFSLSINPVLRTVSYQLKSEYTHYVTQKEIKEAKDKWFLRHSNKRNATEKTDNVDSMHYGPVKEGESLSHIVKKLKLKNISTDQALVMLFHSNPQAFNDDNMNHLIAGAILTIPLYDNEFIDSPLQSTLIVDEHYSRWIAEDHLQ